MSGNIEVGKWAVVYKPYSCCGTRPLDFGIPFIVQEITGLRLTGCPYCNSLVEERMVTDNISKGYWPLEVVKRIDDLNEPLTVTKELEETL